MVCPGSRSERLRLEDILNGLFRVVHPRIRKLEELVRKLDELNLNEGGEPVQRPKPSRNEIHEYESRFDVKLPEDMLNLLRHSNGGHPELDSFVPEGSTCENRWAVARFYHLSANRDSLCLTTATSEWEKILGKGCIPIAHDGGGNQIYLDETGQIALCIHDESFKKIPVAKSFADFIDMLESDPDMI